MNIVFLGLTITSSWGNGHATTYRSLIRELSRRGHTVLFLERDVPWYANQRDMPNPSFCQIALYSNLGELFQNHADAVRAADAVLIGSYVPEGVQVGEWVNKTAQGITAFYDIDTPVTLAKLSRGDYEYLAPGLIPQYDLYLSFTGGPVLNMLENVYGARQARPLYCSVDTALYYPQDETLRWDLGYMGTYSDDRQPALENLLLRAATEWRDGRFIVVGPQYPSSIQWPANVDRQEHLPPNIHRAFYNQQRFTLNITRADMRRLGYSPSVRLFEAAACGVPVISDYWPGLEVFFAINDEILIADSFADTLSYLRDLSPQAGQKIAEQGRQRVLNSHTAAHRAQELEAYFIEAGLS